MAVEPQAGSTEYERVHREAIVIDAVCPLLNVPQYIPWWVEGGVTAAAPTVGAFEAAAGTLRNVAKWVRLTDTDPRLRLIKRAADIEAAKREGTFGIILHFQNTIMYEAGIETPRTLPNLTKRLLERGFTEDETKQVLGGNWLRVFRAVWGE